MSNTQTTMAVQRYLDELAGLSAESPAEPVVRALLGRAVDRLHLLCSGLLHRQYPRLTRGPLNLQSEEVLGAVVERLIKAMRAVRPQTVRQFFALANQHMRWELNDLARRLDDQVDLVELPDSFAAVSAEQPRSGETQAGPTMQRILSVIESLPEDEREVFNLVRIQGMTQAEAAGVTGVSAKTVRRRLNRCLVLLNKQLRDLAPPTEGGPEQDVV